MKTLVTIEVENEIGNPSAQDIELFVKQIIEKGLVGNFYIHKYCPMSGISLRVLNSEIERLKLNDKEIEAIEWCVEMMKLHATECDDELATLHNLLERTKDN